MEQKANVYRPTIMVTNDDGIDAPGLQSLVRVLISTGRYEVQVCAPDSEKSVVSHCITWLTAVSVQQVNINGATAFAVSGLHLHMTKYDVALSFSLPPSLPYRLISFLTTAVLSQLHQVNRYQCTSMLSVPEDVSVDPNSMGLKRGIVRNECQEFIGTPADCTSLGVSGSLFPSTPDLVALSLLLLYENVNDFITLSLYPRVYLHIVWYRSVISGINRGRNCGYHIVTSGTVAGAREAFFNGVPALSLSYDWVGGTSKVDDYTLAAEACLPIVNAMLAEIKNKTYPQKCFLNVNLPTNVASHKCGRNVSGIQVDQAGEKYCQNGVEPSYFCCTRRKNVVNNDNGDKFTDELRNGCLDYAKRTSFIQERMRNFFVDLGENPTWEYTIFLVC
ncbi:hypothetical protein RHGRI_012318 [Rhododendron griersonianum]|uniref:Survival protein SurE-like phosphatase/nucleotidase domain-containing protein n=1 Tax=Rhododendron griersonianum TaxID=479676 RepID=A0AAV6KR40_9ERIC|nr:hypothetical protein RHGRI_012318 [Rhododendron griersonianum]